MISNPCRAYEVWPFSQSGHTFISGAHMLDFITACLDFWVAITAKEERVEKDLGKYVQITRETL